MKEKSRKKLIEAIHKYASDELDEKDWFKIAKESDLQLIDRVINILSWYHVEYNKL